MKISTVAVVFEQKLSSTTNQYDFKRAVAEIKYAAEEDEIIDVNVALDAAFYRAVAHVTAVVHGKRIGSREPETSNAAVIDTASQKTQAAAAMNAADETPADKPKKSRGRPPKTEQDKPKASAAAVTDEDENEESSAPITAAPLPAKKSAASVEDEDETLPGSTAVAQIPDGEINNQIGKAMAKFVSLGIADGSDRVRKLVNEYKPEGVTAFTTRQIPQESRANFLERLAALTTQTDAS